VNPALVIVKPGTWVNIRTLVGTFRSEIQIETTRATIYREAKTNGAWGFYDGLFNPFPAFIFPEAILAIDFPPEQS